MSEQEVIQAALAPTAAYNNKDWDALRAAVIPDFVYDEVATHRRAEGVEQVIEIWQGWETAFPESKGSFDPVCVSGNTVVFEGTWTGTHTGVMGIPGGEIPPTNKSMELRTCQVTQIEDGKVKEIRQYFDMATMMKQLGLAS